MLAECIKLLATHAANEVQYYTALSKTAKGGQMPTKAWAGLAVSKGLPLKQVSGESVGSPVPELHSDPVREALLLPP